MTVNKAILVGNLGQDPEMRTTGGGTPVANLNIATSDRRKDRDGNWSDHTEWHRVVVYGRTAENVGKYLTRGRQVYIEGRIQTRKWQDREGRDRWTTEIVADQVHFLGGGRGGESRGGEGGGYGGGGGGGGGYSRSGGDRGGPPDDRQGGRESGGREDQGAPPDMPYSNNDEDIPF